MDTNGGRKARVDVRPAEFMPDKFNIMPISIFPKKSTLCWHYAASLFLNKLFIMLFIIC
jgi:hypothetical protein